MGATLNGGTRIGLARSPPMAIKPSAAKVVDLDTAFDAAPMESAGGPIIWASVTIAYTLAGLSPTVTIRVPVPWRDGESPDQRRAQALRCARQLIEHACRAAGVVPQDAEPDTDTLDDVVEAITPSALEGVAQELGLSKPTTRPKARCR